MLRPIILAFEQALRDAAANKAPASGGNLDGPGVAAILASLQAALPPLIAALQAHQGVITGLSDILAALAAQEVPYAQEIEDALLEAPAAAETAESWIPWIITLMATFAPVPTWQPGPRVER